MNMMYPADDFITNVTMLFRKIVKLVNVVESQEPEYKFQLEHKSNI